MDRIGNAIVHIDRSKSTFVKSTKLRTSTDKHYKDEAQELFQRRGSIEQDSVLAILHMSSQRYKKGITPCNTSFAIMTHKILPKNSVVEDKTKFSIGLIVEPASSIGTTHINLEQELGIQLPKCIHCGAYINGYNRFTNTGDAFFCCICNELTYLHPTYSTRLDDFKYVRPELSHEGYDYFHTISDLRTKAECATLVEKRVGKVCYYMLELTEHTIRTKKAIGAVSAVLAHLEYLVGIINRYKCVLYAGIFFFNSLIHVLGKQSHNSNALSIYSLADEDSLPIPNGFLFNLSDINEFNAFYFFLKHTLDALKLKQSLSFGPQALMPPKQTILQLALSVANNILGDWGGRLFMFLSSQFDALTMQAQLNDRTKTTGQQDLLFSAKRFYSCINGFYGEMAIRLVKACISLSIVLMPSNKVAVLGSLLESVRRTGGSIWYVEKFCSLTSVIPIQHFLQREFGEATCFNVHCVIHLPRQVGTRHILGNVTRRSDGIVYISAVTPATSFGIQLQIHGDIDSQHIYYQMCASFSTISGQQIIRVCTKLVRLSSDVSKIILGTNSHALINFYAKIIAQTTRWSSKIDNNHIMVLNKKKDLFFIVSSTLSDNIDSEMASKALRYKLRDYLMFYHNALPEIMHYQNESVTKYDLIKNLRFLDWCPQLKVLPELVFSLLKTDMLNLAPIALENLSKRLVSMVTLEGITTLDLISYLCPQLHYIGVESTDSEGVNSVQLPLLASSLEKPGIYVLRSFYTIYVLINISPTDPLYDQVVISKIGGHLEPSSICNQSISESAQLQSPQPPHEIEPDSLFLTTNEQDAIISQIKPNRSAARSWKHSSSSVKSLANVHKQQTFQEALRNQCKSIHRLFRSPSSIFPNFTDDPRHPYTSVQIAAPCLLAPRSASVSAATLSGYKKSELNEPVIFPQETLYLRAESFIAQKITELVDVIQKDSYESRGLQLDVIVFSSDGLHIDLMNEFTMLNENSRGISIQAFRNSIEDHIMRYYGLAEELSSY